MASLIKQKGYYYLQFFDATRQPKRKKIALRTSRKTEARGVQRLLEERFLKGQVDPWVSDLRPPDWGAVQRKTRSVTLSEAVDMFLRSRANCRQATRDHYRWVLSLVVDKAGGGISLGSLTTEWLTSWVAAASQNPHTRHTYLSRVGIFARWLVHEGLLERDPTKDVVCARPPDCLSGKLITEDQVMLLVRAAHGSTIPYLADVIVTAFDLALRLSEVCALRAEWYDAESRLLKLPTGPGFTPKNGLEVAKPVTSRVRSILEGRSAAPGPLFRNTRGRPLEPKHTSKRFKRLARSVGLPESVTFHSLRHGGITRALAGGAPIDSVRRFANHTKIEMTMRYAHLLEERYHLDILKALEGGVKCDGT